MARAIHKLTAREAATIAKPGRHSDGGGLYLFISPDNRRRWTFLYTWRGKLSEAGLGSASKGGVTLKAARDKAAEGRALVKAGVDPIAEWNKPEAEAVPTFGAAADEFLAAQKGGWRNEKHKRAMDDDVDALLRGDSRHARRRDRHGSSAFSSQALVDAGARNRFAPSRAHRDCLGRGAGARLHWAQRSQSRSLARPLG